MFWFFPRSCLRLTSIGGVRPDTQCNAAMQWTEAQVHFNATLALNFILKCCQQHLATHAYKIRIVFAEILTAKKSYTLKCKV